jgi:hypothetical protein
MVLVQFRHLVVEADTSSIVFSRLGPF